MPPTDKKAPENRTDTRKQKQPFQSPDPADRPLRRPGPQTQAWPTEGKAELPSERRRAFATRPPTSGGLAKHGCSREDEQNKVEGLLTGLVRYEEMIGSGGDAAGHLCQSRYRIGVGSEMFAPQVHGQIYVYTYTLTHRVNFLLQQNRILFTRLGLLPAGECI